MTKTSQHAKWMDNLNIDWSSGWILCFFFGCEGKIHKPKPWINQACREIHTGTLGMKLTSVVCKSEIKINLSKSKVKLHPYSKSMSTTKCVILPLFKINMHHQMWNRDPTPNRYAPPPRTSTRGLQHVNWVWRPLLPKKQDKIQPLLQSMLRLSIHFEFWEVLSSEKTGKISGKTGKRCMQFTWN